jgi:hypothetical protein
MKMFYLILVFASACLIPLDQSEAQQANTPKAPFLLTINAKTPVKAGSAVEVKIRLTNISDRELNASTSFEEGLDSRYLYDIRDSDGRVVEKKERQHPIFDESSRSHTLKPGESRDGSSLVSKVYVMSQPGKYVFQLSLPVSNDMKDGVVKSNKISITVTP